MNREQVLSMDVFMLLSIINMKLRDEFENLDSLCEDFGIEQKELKSRLKLAGYVYNKATNQFALF